jgi:segregation and condensation protein B
MQTITHANFFSLSIKDRKYALESLIFAADEPLSTKQIINMLIEVELKIPEKLDSDDKVQDDTINELEITVPTGINVSDIENIIEEINKDLTLNARPYRIINIAGGWQFGLLQEYGKLIHQNFKTKVKKKLSQAALETLAVIAYKQPVSKPEIEQIRGVNSNEVVNSLIEKNFIKIAGRSESLGKPLLYSTTQEFLRVFGINSLDDLPKLKELEEISPIKPEDSEEISELTIDVSNDSL